MEKQCRLGQNPQPNTSVGLLKLTGWPFLVKAYILLQLHCQTNKEDTGSRQWLVLFIYSYGNYNHLESLWGSEANVYYAWGAG